MHPTNKAPTGINPLLAEERQKATFPVREMTYFLDGSQELTERRHYIEKLVAEDSDFQHVPVEFLSREKQYNLAVKKAVLCQHKLKELGLIDDVRDSYFYRRMAMPRENSPLGLHWVMFIPTLQAQCTQEQQQRWLYRAEDYSIIGTYAQTEIGHGTFLRGVETTATYDPSREEFILHTPTISAIKWWPGNLGKSTNYAVVMAQLYTQGNCFGPHFFMLQLRDENTHRPLPGITLGDIGPKMGYNSNDNGFMKLDSVRIPRDHMLMKNSQVLPDGRYVAPNKSKKLTYGTMVLVRSLVMGDAARALAECCTIAVRYSSIRQQGEPPQEGCPEPKIIDYPTQQHKLLPMLATSYALWLAGEELRELYFEVQGELFEGIVTRLPELHANSAGLKAFSTAVFAEGAEHLRMACGGHGFSMASGFTKIYTDAVPACTYEGENTVMLLQTARYLLKCVDSARRSETLPPSVSYITATPVDQQRLPALQLHNNSSMVSVYRHRALGMLQSAAARFHKSLEQGASWQQAFEHTSVRLTRVATAHCHLQVAATFDRRAETAPESLRPVLRSVCRLYLLHGIVKEAGDFLNTGALSRSDLALCQEAYERSLQEIRPQAVPLVDGFDFPDKVLGSVLGRYDGQVYENLYKWAQQSPLNKHEVHSSYYKYIRPLMQGKTPHGLKSRL